MESIINVFFELTENSNVIDSNWISNMLTIPLNLVTFLIGIPFILDQTLIPESIRSIKKRIQGGSEFNFVKFSFLYLPFVALFGNPGVINIFTNHYSKSIERTLHFEKAYYFFSTIYLIFYIFLVFQEFRNYLKSNKYSTKHIIIFLFEQKEYLYLAELSDNLKTSFDLRFMRDSLLKFIDSTSSSSYTGEEIKSLGQTISNLYINNEASHKEKSLLFRRIKGICLIYNLETHNGHDLSYFKGLKNIFSLDERAELETLIGKVISQRKINSQT